MDLWTIAWILALTLITGFIGSALCWIVMNGWIVKKVKESIMMKDLDGDMDQIINHFISDVAFRVFKFLKEHPEDVRNMIVNSLGGHTNE